MGTVVRYKAEVPSKEDLLDKLIVEWRREVPGLKADALNVVGRIQYLGSKFEGNANKALKHFELKYTDFDVLGTLRRTGKPYLLTPTQLRETVLITSGAMTAALDRLERAGLISRVPDATDRRIKAAALTDAGIEISQNAAEARFEEAEKSIQNLTPNEQRELAQLLKKLTTSVQ